MDANPSKIEGYLQGETAINTMPLSIYPYLKEKPAVICGGF
jgi:hypothetical protein